jgi:hypothetical protein
VELSLYYECERCRVTSRHVLCPECDATAG